MNNQYKRGEARADSHHRGHRDPSLRLKNGCARDDLTEELVD